MNEAVSNLNDVVIRIKTGEHDIFNDRTTQEQATSLCIDIVKGEILLLFSLHLEGTFRRVLAV